MKLFALTTIFTLHVMAQDVTNFSNLELQSVKTKYGRIAINRIADYHNNISDFKKLPTKKRYLFLNRYLNTLIPQYDAVSRGTEEYWATPKEFLARGVGDCEDYAIIKYYSLIELGFDKERLFLAPVVETFSGGGHMVLLYYYKNSKAPLVFDNLSFKVLPLSKRVDLKPKYCFNETGSYTIKQNGTKNRVNTKFIQYEEFKKRIKDGF